MEHGQSKIRLLGWGLGSGLQPLMYGLGLVPLTNIGVSISVKGMISAMVRIRVTGLVIGLIVGHSRTWSGL